MFGAVAIDTARRVGSKRLARVSSVRNHATCNPLQVNTLENVAIDVLDKACCEVSMSVQEALDAYQARWEFIVIFLAPVFNVFYFLLFAACALTHSPIDDMFPAENGLTSILAIAGTDALTDETRMKFRNMATQADVFPWLIDTLLPSVFVTTNYNGANFTSSESLERIVNVHRVLGAVEFKTFSAPPQPCSMHPPLESLYVTCHDFDYPVPNTTFYIEATTDTAIAIDIIKYYKASGTWLDASTARLEVNVATYDGELNLMSISNLRVNFQEGGYLQPLFTIKSMPLDPYNSSPSSLLLDIMILTCFAGLVIIEIRDFCYHRRKHKLKSQYCTLWHSVNWLVFIALVLYYLLWIAFCYGIYDEQYISKLADLESRAFKSGTDEQELALRDIMEWMNTLGDIMLSVRLAAMVTLCLLMFRILSSLRFHPHLNMVTATLTASLKSFIPFFCVFLICLSAFVISGSLLFGARLQQFSTIGRSAVTVVDMIFGQFDLQAIINIDINTAVVWFWCAMIILFLVLFNMLLAIVLSAFDQVRKSTAKKTRPYVAALDELWRIEGLWLWPWNRPRMIQFGRAVDAGIFTDSVLDVATVSKQLNMSEAKATRVLRKTKAFLAVMNILREANSDKEHKSHKTIEEDDADEILHELNARIDRIELVLDTRLNEMTAKMALLLARMEANATSG